MKTIPAKATAQVVETEWVTFSGGELEGKRPRALCAECRARLNREVNSARVAGGPPHGEARASNGVRRASQPLCFQCYRAELNRERALKAAGELDTASADRFQCALPLEPVNHARLALLKDARRDARVAQAAASPYIDRRRQAQINARHALQRLADGLRARTAAQRQQSMAEAIHAAEIQFPEAWLPFVASR